MSFVGEKIIKENSVARDRTLLVESKQCKQCDILFNITNKDLEFYDKVSPVFNGEKFSIPIPTLCPDCRAQQILSHRNERNLHHRTCDATGKKVVTIHSPDKDFLVYDAGYWWSDKWDAMLYGKEFDFTQSFFKQFGELLGDVPKISLNAPISQNSEYTNQCQGNKDCYMLFCSGDNENCYLGMWNQDCEYCVDSLYIEKSKHCYEVLNCKNCYKCYFSKNLENCSNVYFSSDLKGCKNCVGCSNLDNKQYYILNISYTKDVYDKKIAEMRLDTPEGLSKMKHAYKHFQSDVPKKYYNGDKCYGFSGDYLQDVKSTHESFNCRNSEYIKYCRDSWKTVRSYDLIENLRMEYCLAVEGTSFANHCLFSLKMHAVNNVFYSSHCNVSDHLFGCVGLNNQKYCLLNKQYTKEEYNLLVPRIIKHMKETGEWGEFFPSSISSFGYNETVAQEYFPLEKQVAINNDFNWSDYETPLSKVDKVIPASKLPECISDIPDDILNWAIECEVTKKPFRIIPQELEFYKKHNLPIPRIHPDRRHLERMALRNPRKLFKRGCSKCGVEMQTTYSPENEEIVYCEVCYNKEID